ncbi:MAG: hypothetical protein JO033_18615 [Acidobacteriaceae bacterium]|nr:hypothetical protein [Acidobacteriaceae bacterium]MBV9501938.1 hypothetical protein [Acidobacteriaceae bacterium]
MGHSLRIGFGLFFTALCFGQVTVRTICSAGCQYTPTQIQQAVNNANPGDIITIDPATGASTVTGLELPAKNNPNHLYITIRSAKIYNLPANTRVSPGDPNLATISYTFHAYLTMFADSTAGYYRFEGITFTILQGDAPTNMIQFGRVVAGKTFDNQPSQLPHDIDFDRCVFSGWAGLAGPYRAIGANIGRMSVTNSYFTEIKGTNAEAQDIGAWNDIGPFYFRNNHFEASSMETLFGGAQPSMQGVRAKDLTFIGNEFYRPWAWRFRKGSGAPTGSCLYDSRGGEWYADNSAGGNLWTCNSSNTWVTATETAFLAVYPEAGLSSGTTNPSGTCSSGYYKNTAGPSYWQCVSSAWASITIGPFIAATGQGYYQKNHFELKNAERVLVEGNFLHQSWLPTALNQHGAAFLFNQVDNANNKLPPFGEPSAVISNVTVLYNRADQDPWGISNGVLGNYFLPIHDVNIHDNLFTNIGNEPLSLGDAQVIQLGNQGKYSFEYNTVSGSQPTAGFSSDLAIPAFPGLQQIEYVGNIVPFNKSGFYDEHGHGSLWDAIDNNWQLNRAFTKNVVVDQEGTNGVQNNIFVHSDKPPFSGLVPCASCASLKYFSNGGTSDVGFVNYSGGDYHLSASSQYQGWWAHGRSAGADVDQVNWSTAQALTGSPNAFLDFKVRSLMASLTSASIAYTSYDATACTVAVSTRPDFANPIFTGTDTGGDTDRTTLITGLSAGTRYFYSLACAGHNRSGQFLTGR